MYQYGHYGCALLVYAPLGLVALLVGAAELALLGGLASVALAMLPDYDQRVPGLAHRGPTHTVAFALCTGLGLAGVTALVAPSGLLAGESQLAFAGVVTFAFLVGTLTICSHLLADALTPAGIRPYWPLSDREVSLNVTRAANPVANYLLFGIGIGAAVLAGMLGGAV